MITCLENGEVFRNGRFAKTNVLVCHGQIELVGENFSLQALQNGGLSIEVINCSGLRLIPGLIDPHAHLIGGSGEKGGFSSQSPDVMVSECVMGGVTSVVGTIGVDTTTRTMEDLVGRARAFNEVGLSAYCYVGGYDIPPRTLTGNVRDDILFIPEVIGVGEIAISDARAPEPTVENLARAVVDASVGGLLTGKAGVSHFHAGGGLRRLQTIRDLMTQHEIVPEKIYVTHLERSEALVDEGIALAARGCFVDYDIHDRDLDQWYPYYLKNGGNPTQLSFSSDAGISSPREIWSEIWNVAKECEIPIEQLLPHVTSVPAKALKLLKKAKIEPGFDADIAVYDPASGQMRHVLSRGKVFVRDGEFQFYNQAVARRRGLDIYGISKKIEEIS